THALAVDKRLLSEKLAGLQQIFKLVFSKLLVSHLFKLLAPRSCASCIYNRYDIIFLNQHLMEEEVASSPRITSVLRTRSTVLVEQNRILFTGNKIQRLQIITGQGSSICCVERKEFLICNAVFFKRLAKFAVVL